jgi:hypothetical protein
VGSFSTLYAGDNKREWMRRLKLLWNSSEHIAHLKLLFDFVTVSIGVTCPGVARRASVFHPRELTKFPVPWPHTSTVLRPFSPCSPGPFRPLTV